MSEHGSGWEVHLRNLREYVHDTAMRSTPTHRESPPLPNNVAIITRFEHAFRAADQTTVGAQQPFMGIPATGQRIRLEGMNFYRLKHGRVTDVWTQFDNVGMLQQLGAMPG